MAPAKCVKCKKEPPKDEKVELDKWVICHNCWNENANIRKAKEKARAEGV